MDSVEAALAREKYALKEFKQLYKIEGVDYDVAILPKNKDKDYLVADWSAKDYLSDIVYWHESFARNIADVGDGRKPNPIKDSLRNATKNGVLENRNVPVASLLRRLTKAQNTIEKYIFNDDITTIPYRKGSRNYSKIEYLDIRTSEFNWHFWAVARSLILN